MKVLSLFLFMIIVNSIHAQSTNSNELLNGRIYQNQIENAEGHPFFKTNLFSSGWLNYKSQVFLNQQVLYDLLNQNVVVNQQVNHSLPKFIVMNDKYIKEFEITINGNKYFFTKKYATTAGLNKNIEFFQIIYENSLVYLIGYEKKIDEMYGIDNIEKFVEKQYHYIIYNNNAYQINRKKDLMEIFYDNKKDIKVFIKKNKLKFDSEHIPNIIILMEFCESLL